MIELGSNGMRRLRHVAQIMGSSSAAAKALAEHQRRTDAGEDVAIFDGRNSLLVERAIRGIDAGGEG